MPELTIRLEPVEKTLSDRLAIVVKECEVLAVSCAKLPSQPASRGDLSAMALVLREVAKMLLEVSEEVKVNASKFGDKLFEKFAEDSGANICEACALEHKLGARVTSPYHTCGSP